MARCSRSSATSVPPRALQPKVSVYAPLTPTSRIDSLQNLRQAFYCARLELKRRNPLSRVNSKAVNGRLVWQAHTISTDVEMLVRRPRRVKQAVYRQTL